MKAAFRIRLCGDRAISVELGSRISLPTQRRVLGLRDSLLRLPGIEALIPSYRSLLISYDPFVISFEELSLAVEDAASAPTGRRQTGGRLLEVPVCYDLSLGPDLADVARFQALSIEEVVAVHTAPVYRVYMLGFTPGFAFLGGLDSRLHTPRLDAPRSRVAPGSVGIAGLQTGAYAIASPGGWRLLGRTPLRLFDPEREEPAFFRPGDRVCFSPISLDDYERLGGRI